MPQFWLSDFAPQIVWLAISFALLYLLMSRVALPRIADVLTARQERIANDLDKAQQFKAQAEKVMAEYEAALAEARSKAQATIAEAQAQLVAEAEKRNVQVSERLAAQAAEATRRIEATKAEVMAQVRGVAVDLVQDAARRLVGVEVPAEEAQRAVESAAREVA